MTAKPSAPPVRRNENAMTTPSRIERWNYTAAELWADGAVHVVGTTFVAAASIALVVGVIGRASPGELAAVTIYLVTLLLSLGVSAVYNIWPVSPTKWRLRLLDHSAIYLLIAGTYTPFMVQTGTWWLLATVWGIAAVGIALKLLCAHRFDRVSILLYLGMGWSGIVAYDRFSASVPPPVLWLVLAGGAVYTVGVIFHVWERLKFQNAIWHAFVLSGACTHLAAVWLFCAS